MNTTSRPLLKVILVGSSGVGKTCLARAFFEQDFDEKTAPTVSPGYQTTQMRRKDGVLIDLQVWDTAGQERYDAVSQLFFRDADVAILCFESGNEKSLESVPDWVGKVASQAPECIYVFVATKCDLVNENSFPMIRESAAGLLSKYDPAFYAITSSLTKVGVNQLFKDVIELSAPKDRQMEFVNNGAAMDQKKSGCC